MKNHSIKSSLFRFQVLSLLLMLIMLTANAYGLSILPPPDFPLLEAVKKNDIEKVKSILETRKTINKFAGKETEHDKDPSIMVNDDINQRGNMGDTPLSTAARFGNLEMVKLLVQHGAEIEDSKGKADRTPLMEASAQGHADVVEYLISKGADVNAKRSGVAPLLEACRNVLLQYGPKGDKKNTIFLLLDNSADVNIQDESWLKTGRTPLMYAVIQGDAALVQAFLANGARLDLKNKDGETALSLARARGLEYISQLLEKAEIDGNKQSKNYRAALHPLFNAVKEGRLDHVKVLISKGTDVDIRSPGGSTPLMFAVDENRLDIVKFLLDKGADVNARNGSNNTALIYASIKGNNGIAEELLKRKADVHIKNINGGDALIYAVINKRVEIVKALLKNGAKTDEKYDSGETALIMAIQNGASEIARILLAAGADANAQDRDMKTALIYACEKGDLDTVRALVAKSANINAASKYGETALNKAISIKHIEIVRLLINSGADIKSSGALFSAVGTGSKEIVKILLEKGADINQRGFDGKTPIVYAASGDLAVLKYLVKKGADINIKDNEGKTPLMAAAESFHETNTASLKFLIEKGANVNARNNKGETALILASKNGNVEMVKVLIEKGSIVSEKDKDGKSAWTYAVERANNNIMSLLAKAGSSQNYDNMEWEGKTSGQKAEFTKIVGTGAEWNELWMRAFNKPAPDIDFENYFVACVFLGDSADWLYNISFQKPIVRDNLLLISFGLSEIILELAGPFRAGGQYRMKVFKRVGGLTPLLEGITQKPLKNRIY
jgi:ankyrin repeat protein